MTNPLVFSSTHHEDGQDDEAQRAASKRTFKSGSTSTKTSQRQGNACALWNAKAMVEMFDKVPRREKANHV